jgi:hypothetical protein
MDRIGFKTQKYHCFKLDRNSRVLNYETAIFFLLSMEERGEEVEGVAQGEDEVEPPTTAGLSATGATSWGRGRAEPPTPRAATASGR